MQVFPGRNATQKPLLGRQIDWGHPLSRGLIGCWPENEGGGNSIFDYGSRSSGVLTATSWSSFSRGSALVFNGSTSRVDVAAYSPFNFERTNSFSVAFWLQISSTNYSNDASLIGRLDTGNSYRGWEIYKQASSNGGWLQLFLINTFPGNCIQQEASFAPAADTPYHAVVTYDGSSTATGVQFYVNGALQAKRSPLNNSLSATIQNSQAIRRGQRLNGTQPQTGYQASPMIWNRTLSAAEAQALYLEPYGMFQAAPWKRYYSFASRALFRRNLQLRFGSRTARG